MAYRIRRKEKPVSKALHRIACEQVDRAIASIEDDDDSAEAIHDIRKRCKRLRGLIRLFQTSLSQFEDADSQIQDIAKALAPLRNSKALEEAYDLLVLHYNKGLDTASLEPLRTALIVPSPDANLADTHKKALDDSRSQLAALRKAMKHWSLEDEGWKAMGDGVEASYKHARAAADKAFKSGDAGDYHKFRTQITYHWHHIRLLNRIDQPEMGKRAAHAKELYELLGNHHDLTALCVRLKELSGPDTKPEVDLLLLLATRQQTLFEERIQTTAAEMFHFTPKALEHHWHKAWDDWR